MKTIKRILLTLLIIISTLSLASCGNRHYFDLEFDTYTYVHCFETNKCYKISDWTDMEVGIKVKTVDYGILYFSEGTYILVGDKCPICNHK